MLSPTLDWAAESFNYQLAPPAEFVNTRSDKVAQQDGRALDSVWSLFRFSPGIPASPNSPKTCNIRLSWQLEICGSRGCVRVASDVM